MKHLTEKTRDELIIEVAQLRFEKNNLLKELNDILEKNNSVIETIQQTLEETFSPQPEIINILKLLRN